MKITLKAFPLAILVCVAAAAPVLARQASDIPEDVKETIHIRVDHGYNVGVIVGIVSPSGTRYFSYGQTSLSGNQTLDENTVFEIGSITKVFTSTLLARMVERGEIRLDDPIERYLPSGVRVPTRNGQSITLAHLATHTSGLPRLPNNLSPANPGNPYADYSFEQMYDFLSNHTLRRDIGAQYEYSNYGGGLLGHILALRTGMNYEELVVKEIADELDMPDTRITLTPEMQRRLATGHSGVIAVSNWDIPTLAGAGALRSTARDMLTFLAANIGLSETRLSSAMKMTHESRHDARSPNMHVGLGWHIRTSGDREIVWHNGGTGGYWSFVGFVRGGEVGVVVLTNTSQSIDDIGFHLLDPTIPLKEISVPAEVDLATLESYVGKYQLQLRVVFDVGLQNGHLTVQLTGQLRFTLYAQSKTEFFLTQVNAQITFVRNDQGEVTALVLHQGGRDQTAKKVQ